MFQRIEIRMTECVRSNLEALGCSRVQQPDLFAAFSCRLLAWEQRQNRTIRLISNEGVGCSPRAWHGGVRKLQVAHRAFQFGFKPSSLLQTGHTRSAREFA